MSDSPNIYLNDPDPLSLLLKRLVLNAEVYVNGGFCGTWAVDTSGSRRIPFHLIGEGQAWLHFDEQAHELNKRDLVLFPHDNHHIISSSEQKPSADQVNAPIAHEGDATHMICGFFEFKSTAITPLLDALPEVILLPANSPSGENKMLRLIDIMIQELKEAKAGSYTVVDQLAYLLFIEILRSQVESGNLASGLLVALFDTRIGKAINAIHQNPEHDWTLASLAEQALMSRSSFAERFTNLVSVSPMKYVTQWRMVEARKLLTSTEMSVAQIAEISGYESEAAFRKAFKQHQKEAPGAVRKAALAS